MARPVGRPRHHRIYLEGYDKAWKKAKTIEEALPALIGAALHAEARRIMARSQQVVPVATGKLKASAYVHKPVFNGPFVGVDLGYNENEEAPYAIAVHEMPRAGQTGGLRPGIRGEKGQRISSRQPWATTGQWKYLEGPAAEMTPTSLARMAEDLRLRVAALVKGLKS